MLPRSWSRPRTRSAEPPTGTYYRASHLRGWNSRHPQRCHDISGNNALSGSATSVSNTGRRTDRILGRAGAITSVARARSARVATATRAGARESRACTPSPPRHKLDRGATKSRGRCLLRRFQDSSVRVAARRSFDAECAASSTPLGIGRGRTDSPSAPPRRLLQQISAPQRCSCPEPAETDRSAGAACLPVCGRV